MQFPTRYRSPGRVPRIDHVPLCPTIQLGFLPIYLSTHADHKIRSWTQVVGDDVESLADFQLKDNHCSPTSPPESKEAGQAQSPLGKSSHLLFPTPRNAIQVDTLWSTAFHSPAHPLGTFERCLGVASPQGVPPSLHDLSVVESGLPVASACSLSFLGCCPSCPIHG